MATTPLAPSRRAFSIMRSTACRRLPSSNGVSSRPSPWRSALNPALIDLTAPMLRTTRPKATPRSCSMLMPGSVNAVVTGNVVPAAAAPVDSVMIGSTSAAPGDCQRGAPRVPGPAGPVPASPDLQVHEGHEWLYVLNGKLRLALGPQDLVLSPGEAA